MSSLHLGNILRSLKRLTGDERNESSDGQLLERFVNEREQAAFEGLVQRHGRMVLSVAQSILNDPHAAEDVFQATFLVLARKAGSIRKRSSVASWLYGAASRIARNARVSAARRRKHEMQVPPMPTSQSPAEPSDLRPVLAEELERMPDKYRAPLVLCYFEGKTNEEAAQELAWPSGTVKGRLARAREMLRGRLARRGVALSAPALALALEQQASAAVLPAALAQTTAQAALPFAAGQVSAQLAGDAVALANQALRQMFLGKVRMAAAALLVIGVTSVGAGLIMSRGTPADRTEDQQATIIVDVLDPTLRNTFGGDEHFQGFPAAVGFSHDDQHLAVLSRRDFGEDALMIQNVATGKRAGSINLKEGFRTAVSDGQRLAVVYALDDVGSCTIELRDPGNLKPIRNIVDEKSPVSPSEAFLAGDQMVLIGARNAQGAGIGVGGFGGGFGGGGLGGGLGNASPSAVMVRDLEGKTKPIVHDLPPGAIGRGNQLVRTPTGLRLFLVVNQLDLNRPDQLNKLELHVLNLKDGGSEIIARDLELPGALAVSPDGLLAAVQTSDQTIEIWNVADKKRQCTIAVEEAPILCHAFSAGGKLLMTAGSNGRIDFRDIDSGKVQHTLKQPRTQQLRLSPDGRFLAASSPAAVKIWKLTR